MLWEAVVTALVAGFSPWTLLIVAGLLSRERPMRHALVFLVSASAVALLVGFLVVEALGSTDLEDRHRHLTVSPAIDLGLGLAILLFVPYLARRTPRKKREPGDERQGQEQGKAGAGVKELKVRWPHRARKQHGSGSQKRRREAGVLAVVALGAFAGSPSPLYLAALHSITKGQPGGAVGTLEVLLVGALFLLLAEVPIILYALAPERTTALLKSANAWLARHGRILVTLAAAGVGCYFTISGLVHLL